MAPLFLWPIGVLAISDNEPAWNATVGPASELTAPQLKRKAINSPSSGARQPTLIDRIPYKFNPASEAKLIHGTRLVGLYTLYADV